MPAHQKKLNPASVLALSASARKRKTLGSGNARSVEAVPQDLGDLDYAIAHPRERVVVQGPKYSVIVPELRSSNLDDGELKRLFRAIVK